MGTVKRENGKVFIEGVRKVTWDSGEMCEFASSLVSALGCMGENISYSYIMGSSGMVFRFTYNPDELDYTNYSIRNIAPDIFSPVQRVFTAVGYAHTQYEPGAFKDDARNITDSIDRGVPVLAYPVVGPSDCSVITGYDEDGEVLLGWSTYQNIPDEHNLPHDATGYFRKPGWHKNLAGYFLIGAKRERLALRTLYLDAIKWAVYLMRLPGMGRKVSGLNGLEAWAQEMASPLLIKQINFMPEREDEIYERLYVRMAINMTMLRDHCLAEPFLRQVTQEVPGFQPELAEAIECYREMIRLRDSMDILIADDFSARSMQVIKVPKIRREYADLILNIRDVEEQAVTQFELLLERLGEEY